MKTLTPDIEMRIGQLLGVLDTDIRHLEDSLAALDQLRRLVVKQDHDGLNHLLSSIQNETRSYHGNEQKRLVLRNELARLCHCDPQQITLSRFEAELTGDKRQQVVERKTKLRTLAARLKNEHAATSRLLADCARFNRTLLNSLLNLGRPQTATYNAAGTAQRQTNTIFMDMQF